MRRLPAALLFLLVLFAALPTAASAFGRAEVVIRSRTGTHRVHAELAVSEEERKTGLMGRRSLAPDAGMLFLFGEDRVVSMWMHDTLVPLDMLFLAADGLVVSISARTTPMSDAVISSILPARGVLELPAGTAARLGVAPGDRVTAPPLTGKPPGAKGSRPPKH